MSKRRSGHATGMAGEYFVMERLFRLGHQPALTLGNAKSIDIIVKTKSGKFKTVSVKAVCGGGKWPVEKYDIPHKKELVFVFLLYRNFENVTTDPNVWVMRASDVEDRKKPWIKKSMAIYFSHKKYAPDDLNKFKDAWHYIA